MRLDELFGVERHEENDLVFKITKWLQKYQRQHSRDYEKDKLPSFLMKIAGRRGELFHDVSEMKLYRGLDLQDEKNYLGYYPFEQLEKNKEFIDVHGTASSWTTSASQAMHFAMGNRTWMGNKKEYTEIDAMFKHYAVVIEHTFPAKQIIMDLEYLTELKDEKHDKLRYIGKHVDFSEGEVIIAPKKNAKYKVSTLKKSWL